LDSCERPPRLLALAWRGGVPVALLAARVRGRRSSPIPVRCTLARGCLPPGLGCLPHPCTSLAEISQDAAASSSCPCRLTRCWRLLPLPLPGCGFRERFLCCFSGFSELPSLCVAFFFLQLSEGWSLCFCLFVSLAFLGLLPSCVFFCAFWFRFFLPPPVLLDLCSLLFVRAAWTCLHLVRWVAAPTM